MGHSDAGVHQDADPADSDTGACGGYSNTETYRGNLYTNPTDSKADASATAHCDTFSACSTTTCRRLWLFRRYLQLLGLQYSR